LPCIENWLYKEVKEGKMATRSVAFLAIFLFLSFSLKAQDSLIFFENSYEEALVKAEESAKPVLFYFYSQDCFKCSALDSLFQTERLRNYLSLNYINVRIDYRQPLGIRLSNKFDIKALPTLVFLDLKQSPMIKMSNDFSQGNILEFARLTINPQNGEPDFIAALEIKNKMDKREQVDSVFEFTVLDNRVLEHESATNLYNQSYLHRTLNDGLAEEHAMKYLKTQKDWTSPKNLQFIMDFASDTRKAPFKFMMQEKSLFYQNFGKEKVDSLIHKLAEQRLYQLQPPPNYKEVRDLMRILSPTDTDVRSYLYFIDLKLREKNYVTYLSLERKFIKKFASRDHERMIRMLKIYLEIIPESYNVPLYLDIAKTANKLHPNDIDYTLVLSKLFIKGNDKCGALDSAVRAYTLSLSEGKDPSEILKLIREIDKMHG
jgi:hypothetical protein